MDTLLEQLAFLVDICENFMALADNNFMTSSMKVNALHHGIEALKNKIKEIYFENGGTDVWDVSLNEDDD